MNYSLRLSLREERIRQQHNYEEQEILLEEIEEIVNPLYERIMELYPDLSLNTSINNLSINNEGNESIGEEMVNFYQKMRFGIGKREGEGEGEEAN